MLRAAEVLEAPTAALTKTDVGASMMAARKLCAIDGCNKISVAKGWCLPHYKLARRNGSPHIRRRLANGSFDEWLRQNASHAGDDCLIWPFWRDKHGYGPSRKMCLLAHGEPPTLKHQAAHSCGNGHLGCVNPKHLRWATHRENQAEMVGSRSVSVWPQTVERETR